MEVLHADGRRLIEKSASRSCDTKPAFFANWITSDQTAFAFSTVHLETLRKMHSGEKSTKSALKDTASCVRWMWHHGAISGIGWMDVLDITSNVTLKHTKLTFVCCLFLFQFYCD